METFGLLLIKWKIDSFDDAAWEIGLVGDIFKNLKK